MLKITIFLIMLSMGVMLTSSCSAVRVTTRGVSPVTNIYGQEERDTTIHVLIGSQKTWDEDLCDGGGLAMVTVQPNFFYSLINVVSLGIWSPVKVRYKCNETCEN